MPCYYTQKTLNSTPKKKNVTTNKQFNKVAGYKVKIQKYSRLTMNYQKEKMKTIIPFTIASKRKKQELI